MNDTQQAKNLLIFSSLEGNEKDVFIITELAGVRKTDLTITLSENQLKISGIKNKPKEIDDQRQYLKGSKYGKFEKIINISENIIDDKINASFKNGVLKVILPKQEKIQQYLEQKLEVE
mgnify:CR=1 FL=1